MPIAIAEIKQETNTFSHVPTTLENFRSNYLLDGPDLVDALRTTNCETAGFVQACEERDLPLEPIIAANSISGGRVTREAFESLRQKLVNGLSSMQSCDGVLLSLHGAMATEGSDDPDGAFLQEARRLVGPHVPVVCTLDLHANVTRLMVECADSIFGYQTYPHTDARDVAIKAGHHLADIVKGKVVPHRAFVKLPMILPPEEAMTTRGPMARLIGQAKTLEGQGVATHVSVFQVQPWLDMPEMGCSVLAVSVQGASQAQTAAQDIAYAFWESREELTPTLVPIDKAIARAKAVDGRPVVFADAADGTGSGSPGDSTAVLEALIGAGFDDVAFVPMVDPEAVDECWRTGKGHHVSLSVGGKLDPMYGKPITVSGEIERVGRDAFTMEGPSFAGMRYDMGRTATLRIGAIRLLLMELSVHTGDPAVYRQAGLEPREARVVVVKSPTLFRASYESIAADIIHLDTPGISTSNFQRLPYQRIPRPMYPWDEVPGEPWQDVAATGVFAGI